MPDWRRMPVSSGAVHRRHVSCSHGHTSVHVVFGGLPIAATGESVSVSSSTPWTSVEELGPDPPAWWRRGQPMQLTMATVAEPAGDEPAAAGDGAGDDKPAEHLYKAAQDAHAGLR